MHSTLLQSLTIEFTAIRSSLSMSPAAQRLYWSMVAVATALLPHLGQLPLWVPLLFGVMALWRVVVEARGIDLPSRWLRLLLAFAAMIGVAATFRTLNGLDAGTALLAAMTGVKLLETRDARDCTMLLFIGLVLVFSSLLYNQSLIHLPYTLGAAWLLTAALLRLHLAVKPASVRVALRITATMVLQALPVAVLLFLFFPRLPGQFWALPARSATTGLSEVMTPGDISELTISGTVAFRAKFTGSLPPPIERYWRGPVLHEFDGKSWRRDSTRNFLQPEVVPEGQAYEYRITLEPTQREWLFPLDAPTQWTEQATRTYDLQLLARRPITTLSSFALKSHTNYRSSLNLSRTIRALDTALPGNANPRMRGFAKDLRAIAGSDAAFITAILNMFRREDFYYTLTPPLLGSNSVDDFLFSTHRGFCEHFASAFAGLMRAANIPARVVTGYQGGEYNKFGDYLLVRQSDAHAWTEVWLEERGWIRVDPTAAVAPSRIEGNLDAAIPADESVPGRFLRTNLLFSQTRLTWDAINNFWNERVVEYNELKQRSLMEWLGIENADWRDLGIAFALTLIVFFLSLALYLSWHYRPRKRDAVVIAYEQLCRKLARAKITREVYEGPTDYLQRAAAARPELAIQLRELRSLYTGLRYGPGSLPNQLSRLRRMVKELSV